MAQLLCAPRQAAPRILLVAALVIAATLAPRPAAAIPVFARIYDKPCGACHTIYPQLNPEGERFRNHGLHNLKAAVEPLRATPYLELPGTLPLALAMAAGGDFIKVDVPGLKSPVHKHFNLEYLAILVGAELGPHLAFLGDYAPLFTNPLTGEETTNTRAGLAFLQWHGNAGEWLANVRGGLFELPLGASPRVHRLSVQSYLTYNTSAFSLLGRAPPEPEDEGGYGGPPMETLSLSSTQLGVELSTLNERKGLSASLGTVGGSNNRFDQNDVQDVFARVGQAFGYHQAGFFLYYSPDLLEHDAPTDSALRFGPDFRLYFRTLQLFGQVLAARDSNPTGVHEPSWFMAGFLEANYRLHPRLMTLGRVEHVGMPDFDDRGHGGTAHVDRRIWETTAGFQWLVDQNVKLQIEGSYDWNRESVSDTTVRVWSVTVRLATAFWPFTPPMARWFEEHHP